MNHSLFRHSGRSSAEGIVTGVRCASRTSASSLSSRVTGPSETSALARQRRNPRWRQLPATAVAIAALAIAVAAWAETASASIPGPSGAIDSCYSNTTGALRVVDSAQPGCARDETPLKLLAPAGLDLQRPYVAFGASPRGRIKITSQAGIRSIKRLETGKYCIRPAADFHPISGVVTAEFSQTSHGLAMAFVKTVGSDCPRFWLEVITGRLLKGQFHLTNDVGAVADPIG